MRCVQAGAHMHHVDGLLGMLSKQVVYARAYVTAQGLPSRMC